MKVTIKIRLKKGILDPQGKTVNNALHQLGFTDIHDLRIGKLVEMNIEETNKKKATDQVEEACRKLLANPVIEDYTYEMVEDEE